MAGRLSSSVKKIILHYVDQLIRDERGLILWMIFAMNAKRRLAKFNGLADEINPWRVATEDKLITKQ